MNFKDAIPPTVLVAARLLRTRATLAGWLDKDENKGRRETLARLHAQAPREAIGRRILVFSFRGWYPHTAWETLIAHALRLRGARVHAFNCGGLLPVCEVNFRRASPVVACAECSAYPGYLVSRLGIERSWLRDYVSPKEIADITQQIARLRPEAYGEWTFDGQPIGELIRESVTWFLRKSRPTLSGRDAAVFRDFLVGGTVVARLAPRLLSAVRPDVVIELNGQFFAERVFNEFAQDRAAVIAYEAGWRKDTLGFDRISSSGPVNLDDAWAILKDRPLSLAEAREVDTWIEERTAGELQRDFYIRFAAGDSEDPLIELGLDPFKPTAVLFSNLVWDTAVLGRDAAFSTIQEWIKATVDLFRDRPDRQLIIRIHPAEQLRPSQTSVERIGALVERLGPLPMNIRVVRSNEQMSSYSLMERCEVGLVYTTTAGLEMALRGKPVVVAARVYYRRRRFTLDVEHADEYPRTLDRAFEKGRLTDQEMDLARRFAHLLLFRYLHRVPVVRQRPRQLPILDPREAALLAPNASEEFDQLLQAILSGGELVRMPEERAQIADREK